MLVRVTSAQNTKICILRNARRNYARPGLCRTYGTRHSLLFFPLPVSLYVYKYTYRDCVETVYKLSLLPNDTGAETFLHEPGAMRSVDWTLITGAPAWR